MSKYSILPRFDFLKEAKTFTSKRYMERFEVSRSTFMRDLAVLATLYDIEFYYDAATNRYIRK